MKTYALKTDLWTMDNNNNNRVISAKYNLKMRQSTFRLQMLHMDVRQLIYVSLYAHMHLMDEVFVFFFPYNCL